MWCVAVVSTYLRSEWFVNRTFGVAPLRHSVYWCGGNISSESVTCRALNFDIDTAIKIKYSFSFLLKPLFHILGIYWCVKKMIWTESGILKCCLQLNFGHPSVKVSTQVSVWAFNKEAVMVGTFPKYCIFLTVSMSTMGKHSNMFTVFPFPFIYTPAWLLAWDRIHYNANMKIKGKRKITDVSEEGLFLTYIILKSV